jgi:hypothetical protein
MRGDEFFPPVVGTTGDGLTPDRARQLRDAGVFAVGISLDATEAIPPNHRGIKPLLHPTQSKRASRNQTHRD